MHYPAFSKLQYFPLWRFVRHSSALLAPLLLPSVLLLVLLAVTHHWRESQLIPTRGHSLYPWKKTCMRLQNRGNCWWRRHTLGHFVLISCTSFAQAGNPQIIFVSFVEEEKTLRELENVNLENLDNKLPISLTSRCLFGISGGYVLGELGLSENCLRSVKLTILLVYAKTRRLSQTLNYELLTI